MAAKRKDWVATTFEPEVVEMIDQVVEQSPAVESRSHLIKIGIQLALDHAVREGINDSELELRVLRFLRDGISSTVKDMR